MLCFGQLWMDSFKKERANSKKRIILDVRTPQEFSLSHIPNALNFPVLSNEEHQEVGTLYHKDRLRAKKLGSAYICRNIADFLDRHPIFHPKHPLMVYCARGGQRSKSLWIILKEIGFDCQRFEGGYKAYRKGVLDYFSLKPSQDFITLYGMTGSGKSDLVRLAKSWSIDLEMLCGHYGSSFGDQANGFLGQPTQAMFENELFEELQHKTQMILIEGESKRLGKLVIPHCFFEAMHQGVKVLLEASMPLRVERIIKMYSSIKEEHFLACLESIRPYISRRFFQEIIHQWENGDYEKIALILLEKYYDRVYRIRECEVKINADDLQNAYDEILALRDDLLTRKSKQRRSPS